ncbi:TetR/AcrR family transcriptional regulator [Aliamphritea hakodatensis]|uniref:TetR/AcrR family transcriptional regulator n=1 Tax=Aliamphritea hakodatensis TaxID=2895352 RepID=UPI0022FD9B78|nr:TetR/AcrR family transcriptional regulator [Aliamphritea hakodatensis]
MSDDLIFKSQRPATLKGCKRKLQIIEVAENLMHQRGFKAVSLDDVFCAADVTKSQFYYYFSGKQALVDEVLFSYNRRFLPARCLPLDSWEKLQEWFDYLNEASRSSGTARSCLLGMSVAEAMSPPLSCRQASDLDASVFGAVIRELNAGFRAMQRAGEFPSSVNTYSLAVFCLACIQGAALTVKASRGGYLLKDSLEHLMGYLRQPVKIQGVFSE